MAAAEPQVDDDEGPSRRPEEVEAKIAAAVVAALAVQDDELKRERRRADEAEKTAKVLADRLALAQKQLKVAMKPLEEVTAAVEAKIYSKVASLSNRNEALERRLKNARFVAEASEELAANAVVKQVEAERECEESARHVRRLVMALDAVRRRATRVRLRAAFEDRRSAMGRTEKLIRNLASDPTLAQPIGVSKRKQLAKNEALLVRLRNDDKAARALLATLDASEALDTALRTAAAGGDADQVRALCGRGARPDAPDDMGNCALDYACGANKADDAAVVRACLEAGAAADGDSMGFGALACVTVGFSSKANEDQNNSIITARALAEASACAASRPLVLAAKRGHVQVVKCLVESTPAGVSRARLLAAADGDGATPLHAAAAEANLHVARYLLAHGARVDLLDKVGSSPLHYAANVASADHDTVENIIAFVNLLVAKGASTRLINCLFESPLDTARRLGRRAVIAALRDHAPTTTTTTTTTTSNPSSAAGPPAERMSKKSLPTLPAPKKNNDNEAAETENNAAAAQEQLRQKPPPATAATTTTKTKKPGPSTAADPEEQPPPPQKGSAVATESAAANKNPPRAR